MAAGLSFFKLSFLLSLLSGGSEVGKFPPSCNRIECPSYEVIHAANGYEIRRYGFPLNRFKTYLSSMLQEVLSSSKCIILNFQVSIRLKIEFLIFCWGFRLFAYIQGKNEYHQKIEMTAPVITQVSPSDGPFCESSFTVSFYVPKKNQPDPAPAENLHIQKWSPRYVAVRQFSGFVSDSTIGQEAAALEKSLEGTAWANAIEKSKEDGGVGSDSAYTVAQYNSPFEFSGRVNEIWLPFQIDD